MQSHSNNDDYIKGYLDKIRSLIELEINTYNKYAKGSPAERIKNYFDITKTPAHNLEKEYAPYKKILNNSKLTDAEKLKQLIAKADETRSSIDRDKKSGSILASKWNYGGGLHYAISEINSATPPQEDRNLRRVDEDIQDVINKAAGKFEKMQDAESNRKHSASGRLEGNNNQPARPLPSQTQSAPMRLQTGNASRNSSTMFGKSAAPRESNADQCVKLLQSIFDLAFKLDIPEKEKNGYIKYAGILKNGMLSSEEKLDQVFKTSTQMMSNKGSLHQVVIDVDHTNPNYMLKLRSIQSEYNKAVEKQQSSRHDNPSPFKK